MCKAQSHPPSSSARRPAAAGALARVHGCQHVGRRQQADVGRQLRHLDAALHLQPVAGFAQVQRAVAVLHQAGVQAAHAQPEGCQPAAHAVAQRDRAGRCGAGRGDTGQGASGPGNDFASGFAFHRPPPAAGRGMGMLRLVGWWIRMPAVRLQVGRSRPRIYAAGPSGLRVRGGGPLS